MTDYLDPARTSANIALSVGNSVATRGAAADAWCATFGKDTPATTLGYFEVVVGTLPGKATIGVGNASAVTSTYCGGNTNGVALHVNGSLFYNSGAVEALTAYGAGDILGFAIDSTHRYLWISKNGTWMLGNPSTGTSPTALYISGVVTPGISLFHNGDGATLRVLASEFSYPIPTGFSAWEAASGTTVALTGLASAIHQGILSVSGASVTVGMTGQSATFGHGSPTANIAIVPTTPTVSVSDVGARVSFGATTAATVTVMYSVNADLSGSTTTTGVAVDSTTDFTGKIDITGLAANTPYYYTPVIGGVAQYTSSYPTFKTLPASGVASAFTFAFGSCTRHGGSIAQDTIFDVVPSSTRFLLHIGDTIYADTDGSPSSVLSQFRLKHRDALAAVDMTSVGWKALRARTPVFTMWDDHEITNDFSAGKGNALYAPARQAFGEYHGRANPDPITSGELYYTIQCGDVGFFMLDGRSFRSANTATDDSSKTILGATQKAALKSWLLTNTSTLKFVVTTTLAAGYATTGQDSWGGVDDSTQAPNGTNGFRTERNEIWDYVDANRISGVAFISGDQHWGGSFKTIYAGRPRYEFLASGFNSSFLAPVSRAADPVNGPVFWKVGSKFNFGLVSVDTTVTPATVSFQSYDPTGSLGSSYLTTLNANQLDAGLPVSVALSGQTMTAGHGALSPTGTVDVALSGQSMSATMGTVKPGLMHALTGQDAQYTQGSVTPVSHEGVTVALVGQATAFAHGQTRPSAVVVLQGRAASFAQGSPTAQTGHNVTLALGGQAAGFAHGNLSSAAFAAMAGQSIHGQTGTFDKASRVGMSGAQAAFIAGTLTPRAGIMITEPGRTALFPAEQRTARFAV